MEVPHLSVWSPLHIGQQSGKKTGSTENGRDARSMCIINLFSRAATQRRSEVLVDPDLKSRSAGGWIAQGIGLDDNPTCGNADRTLIGCGLNNSGYRDQLHNSGLLSISPYRLAVIM